ncbi:unnamed protein product [Pleuronectes platessa]|uniref:Uncharacterized protein n=1 Tax=Pleuronectes platessa TaxID=8262 RepID=A0A9N7UJ21_PLEPL|nr:unnamed protein product [Pleuronectes platessa]
MLDTLAVRTCRVVPGRTRKRRSHTHKHIISVGGWRLQACVERAHLAGDGKIAPRKSKPSSGVAGLQSPPVTYMHICGTEVFSMGVFLLRPGTSMPLHDHLDMNGNLRSC